MYKRTEVNRKIEKKEGQKEEKRKWRSKEREKIVEGRRGEKDTK
jgi:hypothetical protein